MPKTPAIQVITTPGSTLGPCRGICHHSSCAAARKLARSRCVLCHNAVGYNAGVVMLVAGPVHSVCLADRRRRRDRSGFRRSDVIRLPERN